MITIMFPLAGKAQRFKDEGIKIPKPMIKTATGESIIEVCAKTLKLEKCKIHFVVLQEEVSEYGIDDFLKKKFSSKDISVSFTYQKNFLNGCLCSCLNAVKDVSQTDRLCIFTPDAICRPEFDARKIDRTIDGLLTVYHSQSPTCSYCDVDENFRIKRTAEKEVISKWATTGLYYFKSAKMFRRYAKYMLDENIKVSNEFYIAPMYNMLIEDGFNIMAQQIESCDVLGTPEELDKWNASRSRK